MIQTNYNPIEIIEGYRSGRNATPYQRLQAWAYLIKTGECFALTPYYGTTALQYIADGLISDKGVILQPELFLEGTTQV